MKTLIDYALSWLGRPYIWGGDDFSGMDCSGAVQEWLASVGMDPPGDQTADGLFRHFLGASTPLASPAPGALAFYGTKGAITHVAMCIDNFRIIEAGGGGSATKTPADAARMNAFVRIRPFDARRDIISLLLPNYRRLSK